MNLYFVISDPAARRDAAGKPDPRPVVIMRARSQVLTICLFDAAGGRLTSDLLALRVWQLDISAVGNAADVLLSYRAVVSGDSLLVDPAEFDSAALAGAIGFKDFLRCRLTVTGIPAGEVTPDAAFAYDLVILNRPGVGSTPPGDPALYYTRQEADAKFYLAVFFADEVAANAASSLSSKEAASADSNAARTSADNASTSAANAAASEAAAAASQTAAGNSAVRAAASETSAASSAVAAAASEVNAAASADNAQNTRLLRYEPEVANLKYSAALGYYAELTSVNDTVKAVYNVADCSTVALHLRSANSAVTGNISLEVGGHTFAAAAGASGAWVELALDGGFSGLLTVKLLSGLTDSGNPVAVIVDGFRVSCDYRAAAYGRQSRQVAAKPVLYSDALGYYLALDASYGINLVYPVNGITAVALKLKSANSAVTGNAALTVTVGTTTKTAVVAVGASDAWTLITLDAPSSGAVAIVRDTASADDTLKDSGTVVAAIAADINYYYQEV
ncbi:MAG: hypothetical protein PHI85_04045 [Victivallaceae bacterium]|nr:hypothetical protein [Victivallaceae bacterium]